MSHSAHTEISSNSAHQEDDNSVDLDVSSLIGEAIESPIVAAPASSSQISATTKQSGSTRYSRKPSGSILPPAEPDHPSQPEAAGTSDMSAHNTASRAMAGARPPAPLRLTLTGHPPPFVMKPPKAVLPSFTNDATRLSRHRRSRSTHPRTSSAPHTAGILEPARFKSELGSVSEGDHTRHERALSMPVASTSHIEPYHSPGPVTTPSQSQRNNESGTRGTTKTQGPRPSPFLRSVSRDSLTASLVGIGLGGWKDWTANRGLAPTSTVSEKEVDATVRHDRPSLADGSINPGSEPQRRDKRDEVCTNGGPSGSSPIQYLRSDGPSGYIGGWSLDVDDSHPQSRTSADSDFAFESSTSTRGSPRIPSQIQTQYRGESTATASRGGSEGKVGKPAGAGSGWASWLNPITMDKAKAALPVTFGLNAKSLLGTGQQPAKRHADPFPSSVASQTTLSGSSNETEASSTDRADQTSETQQSSKTKPRLYEVQRTISAIMRAQARDQLVEQQRRHQSGASLSGFSLPSMPSLPTVSLPNLQIPSVRPFSSTSRDDLDWKRWFDTPSKLAPTPRVLSSDEADELEREEEAQGSKPGRKKRREDAILSQEDRADTLEEQKERIEQKYETPKNPVVFCHGLLGFDYRIREVLEDNGVEVLITRVPATSSIAARAEILKSTIEEKFSGREINLIGHSMGGLDGRYMISVLKPDKFKVLSLTTISTPHKGSPVADYVIDNIIGRDKLPFWTNLLDSLKLPNGGDGAAFEALGTTAMEEFNEQVPDDPDVKYYSWGACFTPGMLDTFRWSHGIIYEREGPNDGLVSVYSAKHGEYRGTLMGVSHLDLVGWVNHVRYTLSAWAGQEIAFKPATFYLEISDYLAKKGF